ncbi:MAG: hypothetical protein M1837_006488 [Sclerophora amabilis]|nr:MAG: hypothetical protein M1837_006488 [Sclerophora amabilis]
MPHTARKKKQHPQKKRIQVEAEDGWTTITFTGLGGSHSHGTRAPQGRTRLAPAEIPDGYSIDALKKDYMRHDETWKSSQCSSELTALFGQRVIKGQGRTLRRIDNCVCLGLGSIVDPFSRRFAHFQLAALQQVLSILDDSDGSHMSKRVAQDPAFNHIDAEFLETQDFTVLQNPEAFEHINDSTFLYAPHCEWSFLLPALRGKPTPPLVLCNSLDPLVSGPLSATVPIEQLETARDITQKNRNCARFPRFEPFESAFNDLSIYWSGNDDPAV